MGRPSRIGVEVLEEEPGGLRTAISGKAIKMTEGQLMLPG
jgi:predicted PhzF superfamily epimerase YddE/YHI9